MKTFVKNIAVGMCLSMSLAAATVSSAWAAAEDDLSTLLGELKSFRGDFKQRVYNERGQMQDESTGHFCLERPNRFRWKVATPFEQLIVADGEALYTYDIDLEQITIQKLEERLGSTPAMLLSSNKEEIVSSFDIKALEPPADDEQLFELKPKAQASLFEKVHLLFQQNKLTELRLIDSLGQETFVHFNNVELNSDIPDHFFTLDMPKGVDVIDARNP